MKVFCCLTVMPVIEKKKVFVSPAKIVKSHLFS